MMAQLSAGRIAAMLLAASAVANIAMAASTSISSSTSTTQQGAQANRGQVQGQPVSVEQPRSFGHVIGDVLTQRILLGDSGAGFVPVALPVADRVGLWLERHPPRIATDGDGLRWLHIDYQIVNAPQALMAVTLPAITLTSRRDPALLIAAWPLSIGPLTIEPVPAIGDLQAMRPDRPAGLVPTVTLQWRLNVSLAALAVSLASWLLWWLWRNRRAPLPFAHAWRELKRIDSSRIGQKGIGKASLDDDPRAWIVLHRAIDATAGCAVHVGSLQRLFERAPQLMALHAELDEFYRHSAARFFARASVAPAQQPGILNQLCAALRRIERSAER